MNYICPGIGLIALLIALMWWWLRRNSCRHDLELRNVASATNAYEIRVSAYTPATKIVNASAPSNWVQTTNYPASILWKPVGGGPIPSGNPLPGPFTIWVQSNAQPDKRVLIEWLSKAGQEAICKQLLRVGCGEKSESASEEEAAVNIGTSEACRCLSAQTESDEDSNEFAEPDISVDVGTPAQTGYMQVEVPYTIEVEPPTLQFTRQWDVTVEDAMGDEQPVAAPVSDNLNGLATFTLPGPGHYTFYLTATDPATCVSATDRDEDEYTDTAFASILIAGGPTKMGIKPDLCDPLKYHFTNESAPNLTVQDWTVTQTSPTPSVLVAYQPGGNTLDMTFPNLGYTYEVCLKTTDLGEDCATIKTTAIQNKPKFRKDYNSCAYDNFLVQFYNESTSTSCAATWLWDFGDGTTSTAESPSHLYSAPFNNPYTVKLTMSVPSGPTLSTTQQLNLYHWQPDLTIVEICSDGHIIYETSAPNPSWTFPGGTPPTSTESHLRVCYIKSGPKTVKLYAINDDDGYCEVVRDLNMLDQNFSRCCPHDSTRQTFEFDYKGKSYRLLTLLRCYGFPHPVVFARSKLQVFRNNKWKRKPGGAHELRIDLSGNLYTKKASGCHCSKSHSVSGSKNVSNRSRASKRFMPPLIVRTRMRQGDVVATYFVMIDGSDLVDDGSGNMEERRFTLSLWQHNCGCKPI
jgi:PKD repeat protein